MNRIECYWQLLMADDVTGFDNQFKLTKPHELFTSDDCITMFSQLSPNYYDEYASQYTDDMVSI